jgi:hypothetical protein
MWRKKGKLENRNFIMPIAEHDINFLSSGVTSWHIELFCQFYNDVKNDTTSIKILVTMN